MEPRNVTDETLSEQELTYVTGGANFVPVPGSRLNDFGKKPIHRMSPIQEEDNHTMPSQNVPGGMKTGRVVALGVGALTIGATTIGVGIYQARKNS
jgi:hypothetical protein